MSSREMNIMTPNGWCVSFGVVGLLIIGCGDGRVPVSGQVTKAAVPVAEGTISFEPTEGQGPVVGSEIEAGRFSVSQVPPGKKTVRIMMIEKTGELIPVGPPAPKGTMGEATDIRYAPPESVEIIADEPNELSFDLE